MVMPEQKEKRSGIQNIVIKNIQKKQKNIGEMMEEKTGKKPW